MDQFVRLIIRLNGVLAMAGISLVASAFIVAAPAAAAVVEKAPEMSGAPVAISSRTALSPKAAASRAGQCHTVVVCAPPPRVKPPCARVHVRHKVIRRHVEKTVVIVREAPPAPVVIVIPPCPPLPATPVDYPSAIQNGYLVWPSR